MTSLVPGSFEASFCRNVCGSSLAAPSVLAALAGLVQRPDVGRRVGAKRHLARLGGGRGRLHFARSAERSEICGIRMDENQK